MSDGNALAEITELGQRWAAAELSGDADTLAKLLTDDFACVGPLGFILTKDQWLERYTSGVLVNKAFSWEDAQVRTYGDAAIAIGVQAQETTFGGQPSSGRFRVTQVLIRREGTWLIAGIHISPIVQPPGGPPGAR